jgi:hypothetical protein
MNTKPATYATYILAPSRLSDTRARRAPLAQAAITGDGRDGDRIPNPITGMPAATANGGRGSLSRSRCHAGEVTAGGGVPKVIFASSSLPFVSGLNSRVTTNMTAAPVVAISIGMVKPSGWPAAK